jgi:hypothetical protein
MASSQKKTPYFNADKLPNASYEYVCWLDAMGTKSTMATSIKVSANFMFKLHSTVLSCHGEGISLYPIMDGVYITSPSRSDLENTLRKIFLNLTDNFSKEDDQFHKFMVRAAVAYGPVVHGRGITDEVTTDFTQNTEYRNSLMIGIPMIQAYECEHKAAPFGIFIHESARAFAPAGQLPFTQKWWHWFWKLSDFKPDSFRKDLKKYFDWLDSHKIELDYDPKKHREMADEYFLEKPGSV